MSRRTRFTRMIVLTASALAVAASPGIASAASVSDVPAGHAGYYKGRVVSPIPLKVRDTPNTHGRILYTLDPGSVTEVVCKVKGERVGGYRYWGGNPYWYLVPAQSTGTGHPYWVSARYVENTGPTPRYCTGSDTGGYDRH